MKLLWFAALALAVWFYLRHQSVRRRVARENNRRIAQALALLDLPISADESEIIAAHRRLLARVHPDRGGSSEAVHAVDAARDLLLADLSARRPRRA